MYIYILYTIQILIHFILLFLILRKVKENRSLWGLFVFNISIIAWIVLSVLILINYDKEFVVWFVRATYAATSISLFSFIAFIRKDLNKKFDPISIIITITSFLVVVLSFTNLIIKGVVITEYSAFVPVIFGDYSFIFIANFVFCITVLLYPIIKRRKEIQGIDSLRLRYVTTSMVLGGVVAISTNVIIPAIVGTSGSALLGPIAMGIISSLTTYSYLEKRLFSINFLIKSAIYYILLTLLPLLYVFVTILLQRKLFSDSFSADSIILGIITSVLFLLLFFPTQRFLKEKVLPKVTSSKLNSGDSRDAFIKTISTKLDINELGITTLSMISKSFSIKKGGIVIFNKSNASILYRALKNIDQKKFDTRDLLQVIYYWDKIKHSTILVRDEIKQTKIEDERLKRIVHFMEQNDIQIILPLNRKVQLNGVVILGMKDDSSPYTIEDVSFLESIIINASIAFGRAILHQEVEDLNTSLQERVELQTKELKEKVKLLEEASRKENDMIDIMGHELRTPATVIKLNVDFLHRFTDKLPTDRESFLKYVSRIKDAVDTEIKLINTLLTSAKLAGDKIELNREKVNVFKEIDMALHAEEEEAKGKDLQLINNLIEKDSFVFADHARVAEIFYNLISNAVRYTEKGSVTIDSNEENGFIKVMIKDTGRGISKSDLPKLGTKFFRTKTYIESKSGDNFDIVRPGGTGLGLYVTFGLARKMGGRVEVDSEVGKGSTFSVFLPKYKNQGNSKNTEGSKDMFSRLNLRK